MSSTKQTDFIYPHCPPGHATTRKCRTCIATYEQYWNSLHVNREGEKSPTECEISKDNSSTEMLTIPHYKPRQNGGGGGETLQYLPLKIAASKRYKNINITPWHESNAEIMIVVIGEQLN